MEDPDIQDADLRYVVALPRLKSLDLSDTRVTGAGLAKLARLESLETLAIDEKAESREGFEALLAVKQLRALYAEFKILDTTGSIDSPRERWSHLSNSEIDERLHALAALRKSKPELVIKDDWRKGQTLGRPWGNWRPNARRFPTIRVARQLSTRCSIGVNSRRPTPRPPAPAILRRLRIAPLLSIAFAGG